VRLLDYEHQESAEGIAATGRRADGRWLALFWQTETAKV